MASKADFTEQEWKTLSETPTGLVLWISSIDPGFMARVKESWAAGQAVVKGAATELQKELAKPAKPAFTSNNVDEMKSVVLGSLSSSLAILGAKAPDEVGPFKAWIASIGTAVAEAAGGTTPEEAEALAAVQADLDAGGAASPSAPADSAPSAPATPEPAAPEPAAPVEPTTPATPAGPADPAETGEATIPPLPTSSASTPAEGTLPDAPTPPAGLDAGDSTGGKF